MPNKEAGRAQMFKKSQAKTVRCESLSRRRIKSALLGSFAAVAMLISTPALAGEAVLHFDDMAGAGGSGHLIVELADTAPENGRVSTTIYATPRGGAYVARGIDGFEVQMPPAGSAIRTIALTDELLNEPSDSGAFAAISLTLENGAVTGGAIRVSDGEGDQIDLATERSLVWVGRHTTLEGSCAEGCDLVAAWSGDFAPDGPLGPVAYDEAPTPAFAAFALVGVLSGLLTLGLHRRRKAQVAYF